MADPDVTVFLSYRREVSWPLAHAVRGALVPHGSTCRGHAEHDSGEFERVILHQIEARAHFFSSWSRARWTDLRARVTGCDATPRTR